MKPNACLKTLLVSSLPYLLTGLLVVGGAIILGLLLLEVIVRFVFPKRDSKSHIGD